MFFDAEKIVAMREMILSPDVEGRRKALAKLLPFQKADFKGIFGLIVALILQVFYNYILSKIEALTSEMEDSSISLLDMVCLLYTSRCV